MNVMVLHRRPSAPVSRASSCKISPASYCQCNVTDNTTVWINLQAALHHYLFSTLACPPVTLSNSSQMYSKAPRDSGRATTDTNWEISTYPFCPCRYDVQLYEDGVVAMVSYNTTELCEPGCRWLRMFRLIININTLNYPDWGMFVCNLLEEQEPGVAWKWFQVTLWLL